MLIGTVSLQISEKQQQNNSQQNNGSNGKNGQPPVGLGSHVISFQRFGLQALLFVAFKHVNLLVKPFSNLYVPFKQYFFLCLKFPRLVCYLLLDTSNFLFDNLFFPAFVNNNGLQRSSVLFPEKAFEKTFFLFLFKCDRIRLNNCRIDFRIEFRKRIVRISFFVMQSSYLIPY